MRKTIAASVTSSLFLLLVGCSSTPTTTSNTAATGSTAANSSTSSSASTGSAAKPAETAVSTVVVPAYLDPNNALSKDRSVFFDYNDFGVKPEFNNLVSLHGKFLAQNPKVAIRVEGNADERGSVEYNLALGQKRAQAVVNALKVYGAQDNQMEAVSWGEEKPRATGHTEADFAQNRRADVVYPTK
ncbi:peptidoglycan-associated lipoprotein Pal [Curvibacter sp. CHRR-16]|uniref:peptidoglycan-associated lipoprotein Pal n=1 Tax=Curvibacter sp. CHRR-16 TaxID=2835872 RepID=UPI001BDB2112|nr:peptidoglycan-associated lipoprotein Pal [Curvibacter sp. CHRR-16]MBT0570781.1 peptidoglycan-associated lipoprotein Pal [Curvibacter sp. CHRR-16]